MASNKNKEDKKVYKADNSGISGTHEEWKKIINGTNGANVELPVFAEDTSNSARVENPHTEEPAISATEQEWRDIINGKNGVVLPQRTPQAIPQVQVPVENPYTDRAAAQQQAEQGRQVIYQSTQQPDRQRFYDSQPYINPYADRAAIQAAIENQVAQAAQASQAQAVSDRQQFYNSQPHTTPNPYADRAEAQMMAASQPTQQTLQQPYNLFAQQKQTGYPNTTTPKSVQSEDAKEQKRPLTDKPATASRPQNRDYRQTQPIRNTDELARAMGYTSPEEEERLRKASLANMRIMAVADAIRHIGNIVHTTNGAPAQKLTSAVQDEYDRYRKGKALRDAANYKYLSYQQQKAAQDAKFRQMEADRKQKAKQWEQQFNYNMAKDAANYQLNKDKADAYARNQDALAALNKAKQDGVISENQYKALRNEWFPKQQEANLARTKAQTAAAYTRASNDTRRTNAYVNKMNNSGSGGKTANGKGYTYSTKRGSVTIPSDYLSKNKINKRSLLTAMERAGAIDTEWLDRYDRTRWDEKAQDKMLDDAVSNWLMNDDAAEDYMVKHLKGQSSHTDNGKALGIGIGSENEKGKSLGLGL